VSKQLLPVYDKPLVYYPLSTLMLAGIRDILVISTPQDTPRFKQLLGDGARWGMRLSYAVQPSPGGLAQAFLVGREFVGTDSGRARAGRQPLPWHELTTLLKRAAARPRAPPCSPIKVKEPQRYGVLSSMPGDVREASRKSRSSRKSRYAVVGLYFYDNRVLDVAAGLKPSPRGELEITDVNRQYLAWDELDVIAMGRGFAGSTPARTSRCWKPRSSSRRSSAGKD
jgi:glucose-1-phosphate thymidylyltransferase